MTYFSSWEGVITEEGTQTREILEEDASADTDVEYIVGHWPIVDSGGVVTDDESDITVIDRAADGSESNMATGNYTLVGASGSITIGTVESGHTYMVTYQSKQTVACARGYDLEEKNNLEQIDVIGSRTGQLKEGQIEVNFKLDYLFSDNRSIRWGVGNEHPNYSLHPYTITILTASTGGYSFEVQNAMIDSVKLAQKVKGGVAAADISGKGTWIEMGTT